MKFPQPAALRLCFVPLFAVMALLALSGCTAPAPVAEVSLVAYVRGDLSTSLPVDYNKAVDSARQAIRGLEFVKVSDTKDALKAALVARTALDKKIEISLTNSGNKLTDIKIRVGIFGDEQLSQTILDKIKSGL